MVGAEGGSAESVEAAPGCRGKPMTSALSPRMAGVGVTAMTASNTRAWIAKTIGLLLIVISWASIFRTAWRHLGQNRGLWCIMGTPAQIACEPRHTRRRFINHAIRTCFSTLLHGSTAGRSQPPQRHFT